MSNSNSRKMQWARLSMAIVTQCAMPHASTLALATHTPPPSQIRAAGIAADMPRAEPSVLSVETRPLIEVVRHIPTQDEDALPRDVSHAIMSDLKRLDALRLGIETGTPIERWRFDDLRARYQALLKALPGEPAVANVVRIRLKRLTQREQAAKAAATIQAILARSHNRDHDIVELRRQLRMRTSAANLGRSHTYQAVGFMQSSAQTINGHKLFLLIGRNGQTVAHLDIPPGLDPEPVLAHKVGVRGIAHYSDELKSRLITVRDLQAVDSRR
jgi:hypothetical protein